MGQVLLTCLCILFSLTLIIMDLSSIIYNPNKFQIPDIRPSYNLAELNLSLCPIFPTSLKGKLKIELNKSPLNWTQLEAKYRNMKLGGQFLPNCTARHRVAILIPYRNRDRELRILLDHLHPILQRQLITYGIYVIEQVCNRKIKKIHFLDSRFLARKFKHFINFNPLKYIFLACKFKYLSKFSRIF